MRETDFKHILRTAGNELQTPNCLTSKTSAPFSKTCSISPLATANKAKTKAESQSYLLLIIKEWDLHQSADALMQVLHIALHWASVSGQWTNVKAGSGAFPQLEYCQSCFNGTS